MMKLLLDEQLPRGLSKQFPKEIDVHTVQSQGCSDVTNGALLNLAFENGFTALLSADKNIASQRNEEELRIPVVILSVIRLRADKLTPLITKAIAELQVDNTPRFITVAS